MSVAANAPRVAQLFYDTGSGYREADSQNIAVTSHSLNDFQQFDFLLPATRIVSLRFDPMASSGTAVIRNLRIFDPEGKGWQIPLSAIVPFNEILSETRDDGKDQVSIVTTPGGFDPGLALRNGSDLNSLHRKLESRAFIIAMGCGILLIVFLGIYWGESWLECVLPARATANSTLDLKGISERSGYRWGNVSWFGPFLAGKKSRMPLIVLLTLSGCALFSIYEYSHPPQLQLALEMSSSTSSMSQLFFDTGNGYREMDSRTVPISANKKFTPLTFELPPQIVSSLRFDPLLVEGTVILRNLEIRRGNLVLRKIPPADLSSFNQIASTNRSGSDVRFVTVPRANDPGLIINLHGPLNLGTLARRSQRGRLLLGNLCIVAIGVVSFFFGGILLQFGLRLTSHPNGRFHEFAGAISDNDFIVFDSAAIWFYALCFLVFGVSAVADLNGSSVAIYHSAYGYGIRETPLFGVPLRIRWDEWVCHTPAILNEDLAVDRFDPKRCSLGAHYIALVANIPVRHVSTLFRPQFWAFFAIPVDYAFAVYWQFKAFILILGVFTAGLLLTRSTFWAMTGSLWYFFSAYTQWTYTWPSALPEMVGLACTTLVSSCYLTVAKKLAAAFVASAVLATSLIDFILCGYPPHLIPLVWVILSLFIAWLLSHKAAIFSRQARTMRIAALVAVMLVCVAVGLVVYSDLKLGIAAIARTEYPGTRVISGGTFPLQYLMSHFLQWSQTEAHFPPALGNICESTGFLWLAPVSLFLLQRAVLTRFQKYALVALWSIFVLIVMWLALPISSNVGVMFGFDKTGGTRTLAGLGLTNIFIVIISLSAIPTQAWIKKPGRAITNLIRAAGVFIVVFVLLMITNATVANFFSLSDIALSSVAATILIALMFTVQRKAFAIALVLPQALLYGGVNPIERGLDVFIKSDLYKFVHQHSDLMRGKWFVYSEEVTASGFMKAIGCDVKNGFQFIPDVDNFTLFRASGLDPQAFNRDGIFIARPLPAGAKKFTEVPTFYAVRLNISPSDPLLKAMHISYFAFEQKPADSIASQMLPMADGPIGGMWLYRMK